MVGKLMSSYMNPATCGHCGLQSSVVPRWPYVMVALWGLFVAVEWLSGSTNLAAGIAISAGLVTHLASRMYKRVS